MSTPACLDRNHRRGGHGHLQWMVAISCVLAAPACLAQEAAAPATESCINLTFLDRTEVIDDRTVLFRMKGGDYYLNELDRACWGLGFSKRISWTVRANHLCKIDRVTVLDASLTPGDQCLLGPFRKITSTEVEALHAAGSGETAPP